MPIIQSAKKAARQNTRRRERNDVRKRAFKAAVKNVRKLVAAKKLAEAKTALVAAYKTLDKVAKTGFIKKNAASRLKSRLARLVETRSQASK